jgi:diaminopimelate epimerase
MRIEFLKMQGLGNDFMVFDAPASLADTLNPKLMRALADRHTGVGFDQALILESSRESDSRAFYRIFNADGIEVEQCGNGARCIAALLYARSPELGTDMLMDSLGGRVRAKVGADGQVSVDMGAPNFEPDSVPMRPSAKAATYLLDLGGERVEFGALSMGNPHIVLKVADVSTAPVARLGALLEKHPHFPNRTNVGFMQVLGREHIRLRVFERGAGETQACGTGACAAVAIGRLWGLLESKVRVDLPGGSATVAQDAADHHLWLTGPATTVYKGSIDLNGFTGAKQ